jgi:hypothetical protein
MRPSRRPARSIEDCLMADAGLARFSAQARRLARLQRILESATPLARQSRVANIRLGKIVIYAINGAVATKLRQLEPRLAAIFQSEAAEVTGIDIRVQPGADDHPPTTRRSAAKIGVQQKQALTSLADTLPEGSALKAALMRLVERAKER